MSTAWEHEPAAPEQLMQKYTPLSAAIAGRFTGRGVALEDLKQVALAALFMAATRFDPGRGIPFAGYATPVIAGAVRNAIRDTGSAVHITRQAKTLLRQLSDTRETLRAQWKREPTLPELAKAMRLSQDALLALLRTREGQLPLSMDAPLSSDERSELLGRLRHTEAGYEAFESADYVAYLLKQLTHEEAEVLRLRFMERLSQRDTAKRMSISQMQVSRLERRALTQLRKIAD